MDLQIIGFNTNCVSRDSKYWIATPLHCSIFASFAQYTLVKANLSMLAQTPLNCSTGLEMYVTLNYSESLSKKGC